MAQFAPGRFFTLHGLNGGAARVTLDILLTRRGILRALCCRSLGFSTFEQWKDRLTTTGKFF